ncbi:MAG: hypothetical protein JRE43_02975 [Deltaproteobacteria bacterium]|jgi:hypothetical protein|nr:hypothetical protein [Deltaproteobacteria bacterium]
MTDRSRFIGFALVFLAAGLAGVVLGTCGERSTQEAQPLSVAEIEQSFEQLRALGDQIDVTRSRGANTALDGVPLADLIASYGAAREQLQRELATELEPPPSAEDERALKAMRHALKIYLPEQSVESDAAGARASEQEVDCNYDPRSVAKGEGGYEALSKRIYACFSIAAHSLSFEGEPMDRLTVFGRLPLTADPARREGLWRAMLPIWQSVNGDNGPDSPWRTLIRLNAARMQREGEVLGESVRGIGVEPEVMEAWLVAVLQKWHDITPDAAIEPWDFGYNAGRGNRALSNEIPVELLRSINDRFYRDLGADPVALQVQYDLEPRASKDPVAFSTFGRRPRLKDGAWVLGEPWVFASYQMGGLDNLLELLHETGHAIHIAAIRTRPAFMDWPDSDIFTEGIADIATLEMYEPAWQQRYLMASIPLQDAIAAKYAAIVMDIAWALFEVRMHRAPERDPNEVWSEICQAYFRINPHPELAWWAVRGQLIDSPGYMMNYAAGAIFNADLRARAQALYGTYTEGDPSWYGRISDKLYRFGLEKSSKEVIEAFLGRPVSPQALLDDMSRAIAGEG